MDKGVCAVIITYALLILAILTFKLWIWGSLFTSSIKSISDDCGKRYPVEVYVIDGNWFCK